jgi:hypothetical protein
MEYWEFLLQKEGERSWQTLKSEKLTVEPGRYRIVAHSSRTNADVEICVTHTTIAEVPPKRRSQKRSRRTNTEGLMVVIPFTYLKPGMWELRCCGDIMSDFLGKSWQNLIQLEVLAIQPSLSTPETIPSPVEEQAETQQPTPSLVEEPALASIEPDSKDTVSENGHNVNTSVLESEPEILSQNSNNGDEPEPEPEPEPVPEPVPVSLVEVETLIPFDLDELDAETINRTSTDAATPSNPILEQSLQMLEQILQQVLDPVLEEFDEAEASSSPVEEVEEIATSENLEWQGLTLTLKEDSYAAKRGEALTISGLVEFLNVNTNEAQSSVFQGSLRYQLRDPQSSQLLLDVQHTLPEQAFPLSFNHSLEIPPCQTRLILGKIILYSSTLTALTSQPFTVTADLDELLESIIPGTKVMPVAKMLVLANQFATLDEETLKQYGDISLEPIVIDLIDTNKTPERPLAPTAQKFMPPQIYQPPTPTPKGSKSLDLPSFPKLPSADAIKEEVKLDEPSTDIEQVTVETTKSLVEDASSPEMALIVQDLAETTSDEEISAADAELSVLLVSVDDTPADVSEVLQEAATITPVTETAADLELSELWGTPEIEPTAAAEVEVEPTDSQPVDSAFQALNSHDRFLLRLNSLATDGELAQWLQSDLVPAQNSVEVASASANPHLVTEVEDVSGNSENLIADFEALSWENSDEFGLNLADPKDADLSLEEPLSEQVQRFGVGDSDWATEEIVVDDDDEPVFVPEAQVQPDLVKRQNPETVQAATQLEKSRPLPVPVKPEMPIPAPTLVIPKNELAVGEPVVVRVKLPPHSVRLCVKLWVQDRQSRALLDGPRWLVDLLPDGAGQLEAMTQVVVPFGFAEIRFEAIAVDLDSQRESHKVTVDCAVMPPDLPNFSMDDFEA